MLRVIFRWFFPRIMVVISNLYRVNIVLDLLIYDGYLEFLFCEVVIYEGYVEFLFCEVIIYEGYLESLFL